MWETPRTWCWKPEGILGPSSCVLASTKMPRFDQPRCWVKAGTGIGGRRGRGAMRSVEGPQQGPAPLPHPPSLLWPCLALGVGRETEEPLALNKLAWGCEMVGCVFPKPQRGRRISMLQVQVGQKTQTQQQFQFRK